MFVAQQASRFSDLHELSGLDITTAVGQACSLTPGDVIQRKGADVADDGGVAVEVVSSKPNGCAAGSGARVQVAALQEMQNQFREQIDSGLKALAENQAKGLPSAPPSGAHSISEGIADPASDTGEQIAAQEADAARVEAQVRQNGGTN